MKKLIQRLLMFFIGVPLVVLVVLLPQKNHLAVNVIVVILSALGALEFANMLKKKPPSSEDAPGCFLYPVEVILLGILGPAAMTLSVSFKAVAYIFPAAFILGASWCLISNIFSPANRLDGAIGRVTAGFAVMFYPGIFILWIIRMTLFPQAEKVILLFLLTVFANDSIAWAAGMIFGKNNRGLIPASPNKSAAGFIGGLAAATLAGLAAVYFVPAAFNPVRFPRPVSGIIIGLAAGLAATLGDLAESAMKRSSDIKDSGTIIPGRGGVLDTIDSIAMAAPVYYILYWILFRV
ncbi:MAG: phosphatidate cytidylyltransferase [Treponema sp.]|jgi:phosphatidate cytidylyltransferase|nr:phosphatidate cytidylyltransferase [Treponema sp.]